ncbi:murein L,D-transpeptidase catalytic domain-containing protein [Bacteriovorax sp. BAL6_X]|uniref:murein L,D-transpeptidase catalytic domain-containing protein n=1 Tax=Bacteriovorax sp. BAL6_X TaxID=1201290 RepID=UPI00042002E9|nr:murein L,D-transpeptidase catalytic domain family protein [Bacteriovorax sp. BAL6_X]
MRKVYFLLCVLAVHTYANAIVVNTYESMPSSSYAQDIENQIDNVVNEAVEDVEMDPISSPESAVTCDPNTVIENHAPEAKRALEEGLAIAEAAARGEDCQFYEKFLDQDVPIEALKQSLLYYKKNKSKFKNKNYITIADYSKNSKNKRFYLLDMKTGEVKKYKVSHGSGKVRGVTYADATISDSGRVTRASNHVGKLVRCRVPAKAKPKHDQWAMTRPGFFKTGEFYMSSGHDERVKGQRGWPTFKSSGRNYNGMRLDGLSKGVNDKARSQGVVMHEAYYNRGNIMGRSFGCPAFVPGEGREIMEKINNGSLYYSYVPNEGCRSDYNKALKDVKGWERMCTGRN